jgi:CHASE3 domain sensor protein
MTILKTIAALAVFAMLGSSFLAYSILRRADATGELVLNSHRTLEAAEEMLRRVLDGESSVRRYVATRDRADLVPFDRAALAISGAMGDLESHVGGDPERKRIQALRADVNRLFDSWRAVVVRVGDASGAADEAREDEERRIDAVRQVVRDLRRTENDRLVERMRADASASRSLGWMVIVAAGVAAALGTATVALLVLLIRPGWGRT